MAVAGDPLAVHALLSRKTAAGEPPDGVEAMGRRRIAAVPLAAARRSGASAAIRQPVLRKLTAAAPVRQGVPRPEPVATPFTPSTGDRRSAIDGWALHDPARPALPLLLLALTGLVATSLALSLLF